MLMGFATFATAQLTLDFREADSLMAFRNWAAANEKYEVLAVTAVREKAFEDQVYAYSRIGYGRVRMGKKEAAYPLIKSTFQLAQQHFKGPHPSLADCHYALGVYFDYQDQADSAIYHLQKALAIRLDYYGANHVDVAYSYKGLGDCYRYVVGNFQLAALNYEKALAVKAIAHLPHYPEVRALNYSIGITYRKLGNYSKALVYCKRALSMVSGNISADQKFLSKCQNAIANIHYQQEGFGEAIPAYKAAIELNNAYTSDLEDQKRFLINLGESYQRVGHLDSALHTLQQSILIAGYEDLQADCYLIMGLTYQALSDFQQSKKYLKECLTLRLQTAGVSDADIYLAYQEIGRMYDHFGHTDSALVYIQKGLQALLPDFATEDVLEQPQIFPSNTHHDLFNALIYKALALRHHHQKHPNPPTALEAAHECYKMADNLLDSIRLSFDAEKEQATLSDHNHEWYEKALATTFELYQVTKDTAYLEQGFRYMERNKAMLLYYNLINVADKAGIGISDSVLNIEKTIQSELAEKDRLIAELLKAEKPDMELLAKNRKDLIAGYTLLNTHRKWLAVNYPEYYATRYQNDFLDIPAIQQRIGSKALLSYFVGDSDLYVMGITQQDIHLHILPKQSGWRQQLTHYQEHLYSEAKKNAPLTVFEEYKAVAHDIYQQLVAPVLQALNRDDSPLNGLIIIREGRLTNLPFESLLTSNPNSSGVDYRSLPYLIREYPIICASSANILFAKINNDPPSGSPKVLGMSYSASPIGTLSNPGSTRKTYAEVPGTAMELKAIAAIFDGTYLEAATKADFMEKAAHFDILHLALHGEADRENEYNSHLVFKTLSQDSGDNLLYAHELYNLNLPARLTVLSACETGVGKLIKGEGMFSMARGFRYAGCPSVLMSLWPLNDDASAQMMGHFYQELSEGQPIDVSLQQAKLAYLDNANEKTAHPSRWAAVVAMGANTPLVATPTFSYLVWLLLLLGGLGLGLIILYSQRIKSDGI